MYAIRRIRLETARRNTQVLGNLLSASNSADHPQYGTTPLLRRAHSEPPLDCRRSCTSKLKRTRSSFTRCDTQVYSIKCTPRAYCTLLKTGTLCHRASFRVVISLQRFWNISKTKVKSRFSFHFHFISPVLTITHPHFISFSLWKFLVKTAFFGSIGKVG